MQYVHVCPKNFLLNAMVDFGLIKYKFAFIVRN